MTSGGGGPPEERHNHSKGLPMSTHPAHCLIPLTSSEPLWEWDIVSDALFLSLGACSRLRLPEPPTRMADFLGYIPPHALPRLNELREGVLSGTAGSCLECDYPFNNQWIQEHLLVLARNEKGRASKIMGRFTITPALAGDPAVEAKARQSGLPEVGIWIYSVPSRNVWRDSTCAALLGETASGTYSVSYDDRTTSIHPADRKSLLRRYRLFIEQKFLGESIDDIIRVRLNNGQYARMLVRGSVLERDHTGRATLLAGTLQREESLRPGTLRSSDDERLHYALDTVGDGLWDWDLRTNAVYYSPRCLAMLGYTPEQFPAHVNAWKDKIHPDDHDKIVDTQLAVIQSPRYGDSFECTYRMRRADGGWAWLFGRGCVTRRDENGRACHLVNIVTNITTAQTERDRLEELVKNDALTGLRSRAYCNLEAERIAKKQHPPGLRDLLRHHRPENGQRQLGPRGRGRIAGRGRNAAAQAPAAHGLRGAHGRGRICGSAAGLRAGQGQGAAAQHRNLFCRTQPASRPDAAFGGLWPGLQRKPGDDPGQGHGAGGYGHAAPEAGPAQNRAQRDQKLD